MNPWLLFIPFISAFLGWFSTWVAIKMLFHPMEPRKMLGVRIHGLFPKRQQQFAEKLGKLISEELFSFRNIEDKITNKENLRAIMPLVESHIDNFLRNKLGQSMPMIGMFIGEKTITQLKGIFMNELEEIFPVVMVDYMNRLGQQFDLEKVVIGKIAIFSTEKLEAILHQIMAKEFRSIQIIGTVLGFVIGLLQILITILTT